MTKTIALGLTTLLLLASTAGFAFLYFNQAAEIKNLKKDMQTLQETTPVTGNVTTTPGVMSPEIVNQVAHATVRIEVIGAGFIASGSGFVVSRIGYVLTNEHVVNKARSITVTFVNGDTFSGKVLDSDPVRDLAIVRLDTARTDLPALPIASDGEVNIGATVMAIGYPLGMELSGPPSFTSGIVSARRSINGLDYIQTDAALNSGNSGGPLVDYLGRVVGVCTGAVVESGVVSNSIGLAIPVTDFLKFMSDSRVKCGSCHA